MNALQEVIFAIYGETARICRRHGLRFYALGGTLLGAVRHQGFIPWDDDMDIGLPRPDYDRFVEAALEELPEGLALTDYRHGGDIPKYYAHVEDVGTSVSVTSANRVEVMPAWLDVFPLDAMPSSAASRLLHKYRLLYHRMKVQLSLYEETAHQHRPNRPFHERAIMRLHDATGLGNGWDPALMIGQTERAARRYDYGREEWLVNLFGAYKFREMFPKAWFGEGVGLPFEGATIPCPVEYERVLAQMYGDWHRIPSVEEQKAHHCLTVVSLGGGRDGASSDMGEGASE